MQAAPVHQGKDAHKDRQDHHHHRSGVHDKVGKTQPAALPIMMLGGSPMRVAVPPTLEAKI